MFALFFSLYLGMFSGSWTMYTWNEIFGNAPLSQNLKGAVNSLGTLLTNIFNDAGNYQTLGSDIFTMLPELISLVLATITSISIVVMAVKGVKKAFGIFFMGVNRL